MKKLIILLLLLPIMARGQYLPKGNYTNNQVNDNGRVVSIAFGIPVYSTSAAQSGYTSFAGNFLHLNSTTKALGIYDGAIFRIFPDKTANDASYVPQARTITINGTTLDLSANRSYTVPTIDTASAFATLAHRNTNNTMTGNNVFTKYVELPGAMVLKPVNGASVGTGNAYINVSTNAPNVFNFTAPNTAGTFLDLNNTADVTRIARLSDISTRQALLISSSFTMVLNTDYLNTSATQYTITLPTTTGFTTDGSKIITVLATGTGGVRISVPSGYAMQSGSSFATTTGSGGATLTQGTKVQLIPVGSNSYYLQPLNGSVTLN